jgi:hypothetical protein
MAGRYGETKLIDLFPNYRRAAPFFSYYGSKWRSIRKYPRPRYGSIIEPFAGSASYATHYVSARVALYDLDPVICGVWDYLIRSNQSEIMALPILRTGDHVEDFGLIPEATHLIGFWINRATVRPCQTPSKSHGWSGWDSKTRGRLAGQVSLINHWTIQNCSYDEIGNTSATWFIDPPYEHRGRRYRFGSQRIDYAQLADWCHARIGQAIVCEQDGASWMPFQPMGSFKTARGIPTNESIWINNNEGQTT